MNAVWPAIFQNFAHESIICGISCACLCRARTYVRVTLTEGFPFFLMTSGRLSQAWSTIRGPDLGFQESASLSNDNIPTLNPSAPLNCVSSVGCTNI